MTLEDNGPEIQVRNMMEALLEYKGMNYIITKANADAGGSIINSILAEYAEQNDCIKLVSSLGLVRYLSALRYCRMVIGNSSSGILEAPAFCIPTVNIGDRQTGRIKPPSVIDCLPVKQDIMEAIDKALSPEFIESIKGMSQIYGNGNTSTIIVSEIKKSLDKGVNLMKAFYDLR